MTHITINKSDSKHRQKCYNYKEADLQMTIPVSEPSRRLSGVPGPRHLNWGKDWECSMRRGPTANRNHFRAIRNHFGHLVVGGSLFEGRHCNTAGKGRAGGSNRPWFNYFREHCTLNTTLFTRCN